VEVVDAPCPGWMELVETPTSDAVIRATVERGLAEVLARDVDVLVLGCTHYPFLRDYIQAAAGGDVEIIDVSIPAPGEPVARKVPPTAEPDDRGTIAVQVTGPTDGVADRIRHLTGLDLSVESVTFGDSAT